MNETVEVFSPVGAEVVTKGTSAPRLETLDGKTVGETWNGDFKGDVMFPVYRELLRARFPGVRIIPYTEFPVSPWKGTPEQQRDVARQIAKVAKEKGCDALISGNGGEAPAHRPRCGPPSKPRRPVFRASSSRSQTL